jgi:hypothetical protein
MTTPTGMPAIASDRTTSMTRAPSTSAMGWRSDSLTDPLLYCRGRAADSGVFHALLPYQKGGFRAR